MKNLRYRCLNCKHEIVVRKSSSRDGMRCEKCNDGPFDIQPTDDPITLKIKLNIKKFQAEVHENAKDHGWWDEERGFGELIALCHSELSEALEEYRSGRVFAETYYREDGKPEGIPSELADVIIRVLDMCGRYEIDIESMLQEKHKFNKTRPYKHGNKVI